MSTHEPSHAPAGIPLQAFAADLRSRCEAVSRLQGGGTYFHEEFAIFRQVAAEQALFLQHSPDILSRTPDEEGNEHQVWYLPDYKAVLKATWPDFFGLLVIHRPNDEPRASPVAYLERWALHNELFGDNVRFLGALAAEYRQAVDALPYSKRLPGAVYLIDPGDDPGIPSLLRITAAELRKRLEIGPEFNLLKFHTASPKLSFLAYPDFQKDPHPTLAESVIIDLVTGKIRRDDYRGRANPPILHRKETFLPPDHPLREKFAKLTRQEEAAGLLEDSARIGF